MSEAMPTEENTTDAGEVNELPQVKETGEVEIPLTGEQLPAPEQAKSEVLAELGHAVSKEQLTTLEKQKIDVMWELFLSVRDREKFLELLSAEQRAMLENPRYGQMFDGEENAKRLHPEWFVVVTEKMEDGPLVEEFEKLVEDFERDHSIEALLAITELEPFDEAPKHPIRQPAKLALVPIFNLIQQLKNETNISPEKIQELDEQYTRLRRAVGSIKPYENNRVDHINS